MKSLTNQVKNSEGKNQFSNIDYPVKEMYNSYLELHTIKAVANKFNLHEKTVARVFKANNLKTKGRGYATQKVFKNPFINKDKSEIDYWVGFIAGDGYLHPTKKQIQIGSNDLEIIENFKNFIGEGVSITKVERITAIHYVATFSHKGAYNYLYYRGLTTKKSKTLMFTQPINWNILRGLFDADGSFSQERFKITTGSYNLAKQLADFCREKNIKFSAKYKATNSTTIDFYFLGGKPTIKLIYNNFYNNTNLYLNRKEEQIRRYLQ
tara:strand:- start:558 stop:1355 length:798 start_codon:yes stop_codon:yes gene_type:complete